MNRDLLATHQILTFLEKSKSFTETVLDDMPGYYLTINVDGVIFRSNHTFANLLGKNTEEILGTNFSQLFQDDTWQDFQKRISQLSAAGIQTCEFETPIDFESPLKSVLWQAQVLNIAEMRDKKMRLFSILGKDISELKNALNSVAVLGKNLELAKATQDLLLPQKSVFESAKVKIAGYYEPAEVAGGDFWWHHQRGDEVFLLMGDVTGHGAGSAMVTSLVAGSISTLAKMKPDFADEDLFRTVNDSLFSLEGQPYWMTLLLVHVVPKSNSFHWVSAAAPPLFHLRENAMVDVYSDVSSHLGSNDFRLAKSTVRFGSGERLLLFTDGAFEMIGVKNQPLGLRGLQKALMRTRESNILEARTMIDNHLKNWRNNQTLKDDVAFVLIDFLD